MYYWWQKAYRLHRTEEVLEKMNVEAITDSNGNTLSFIRQIPSYGFELVLKAKDGTSITFDLAGDNLKAVAEKLGSAAAFAEKFGR
jgi:hypothetical protein